MNKDVIKMWIERDEKSMALYQLCRAILHEVGGEKAIENLPEYDFSIEDEKAAVSAILSIIETDKYQQA